jgi:EAL domain-containing protein (putative c-di-GMP-specific phosphodiesterase class I)
VIAAELVARAAAAGFRVAVDDLGTWGGRARLFAECDPAARAIRIDRRSIELVRARGGEDAERAFIAYAIAHELAHAALPAGERAAAERRAHALAEAESGVSASSLEAWLAL